LLHELVRTNLETWLSTAAERDEYGRGVPLYVEAALRGYLKCGILAHGFDETTAAADWPEMDQTAGQCDGWE
jgi:hypothetical protein